MNIKKKIFNTPAKNVKIKSMIINEFIRTYKTKAERFHLAIDSVVATFGNIHTTYNQNKFIYAMNETKLFHNKTVYQVAKEAKFDQNELDLLAEAVKHSNNKKFAISMVQHAIVAYGYIYALENEFKKVSDLQSSENEKVLLQKAKFLGFLYRYGYIEKLNVMVSNSLTEKWLQRIETDTFETKLIENPHSRTKTSRPNKSSFNANSVDMEQLINNCVATKYKYEPKGMGGKHLSHKSPIAHIRQGYLRSNKNGSRTYVKPMLINADSANDKLERQFKNILKNLEDIVS